MERFSRWRKAWRVHSSPPSLQRLLRNLKRLRVHNGLTQEGFAELASISYKYYQSVETGKQADLRLSTLDRLAKAYGLDGWLLISPKVPIVKLSRAALKKLQPPHYRKRQPRKSRQSK